MYKVVFKERLIINMRKKINFISPLCVTIFLIVAFAWMLRSYSEQFEEVKLAYSEKRAVNLEKGFDVGVLSNILYVQNYADNKEDADFFANFIADKFNKGKELKSLNELTFWTWQVPHDSCTTIGLKEKCEKLKRDKLGLTEEVIHLYSDSTICNSEVTLGGKTDSKICVKVQQNGKKGKACEGVVVRLCEHGIDSIGNPYSLDLAYIKTDKDGIGKFCGLDTEKSYSVLPIKDGFEYGNSKGTISGSLKTEKNRRKNSLEYIFYQRKFKVRMFDISTMLRIKNDGFLTIRTPDEFQRLVTHWGLGILVLWLLLWCLTKSEKGKKLICVLYLLSCLGIMNLFSINNPLIENILASGVTGMAMWVCLGIVFMIGLQFINPIAWYQKKRKYTSILTTKLSKGWPFLALTFIILFIQIFFPGRSVGGAKVNISLGPVSFQPSEIVRCLMVGFLAAYFCEKGNSIRDYSQDGNWKLFGRKLLYMLIFLLVLLLMMGLYIGIIKDSGPALVIILTTIIMYSFIKSKKINNHNSKDNRSDIKMLLIGVASFVFTLFLGHWLDIMYLLGVTWFLIWILYGIKKNKQIFESAILFNAIIFVFLFIGDLGVLDNLTTRSEMCTNTWGTLPIDGKAAKAGVNSQVADGLWGLATGGFWGQGPGQGTPRFIPAYHTDMILESIGLQYGVVGILIILVLYALLLRETIAIGKESGNDFTFFLCVGIAVITAVQFVLISLGSTGLIPLTGITVPFFSKGGTSLLMNLIAYGVVLSISEHPNKKAGVEKINKETIESYKESNTILHNIYVTISVFIAIVFFYYSSLKRNDVLIRPYYEYDKDGMPSLKYNPRIVQIEEEMQFGDIYDRNGILLATCDKNKLSNYTENYKKLGLECNTDKYQRRYYPFDRHLFFMIGDRNRGLCSEYAGYAAESRHISELRGYDNKKYDKKKNPIVLQLTTDKYRPERFCPNNNKNEVKIQLRDYSELLPYLKGGMNSNKVKRYNKKEGFFWELKPKDVQLTVDARLQTLLQQRMEKYIENKIDYIVGPNRRNYKNRVRASVVVLDAHDGDLLASANYPLPDYDVLKDDDKYGKYNSNHRDKSWKTYSDRDMGLLTTTPPGSTAKVMSALAGLQKLGKKAANERFKVYKEEKVGIEPPKGNEAVVDMEQAIVESSNCYFINLVNKYNLYPNLSDIYYSVGAYFNGSPSYTFNTSIKKQDDLWKNQVTKDTYKSIEKYNQYIESRIPHGQNKNLKKLQDRCWLMTWGQGDLSATPLTMARVASIVANGGAMPDTRYVVDDSKPNMLQIVSNKDAVAVLKKYMQKEASVKKGERYYHHNPIKMQNVGGKTGTAEREVDIKKVKNKFVGERINDGWYMCFVDEANVCQKKLGKKDEKTKKTSLAIVVRIEYARGSGAAVNFLNDVVVDILQELGYIE